MTDEVDITLRVVLEHVQAVGQAMQMQLDAFKMEMREFKQEVRQEFLGIHHRMDRIERNLTGQIDAIDKRLDTVEIEELPKKVASHDRRIRKLERRAYSSPKSYGRS